MAGVQELLPLQAPRPLPRRAGTGTCLALIGAAAAVLSVAGGSSPVHAGLGLVGFLLWLMGVPRLLLFGQMVGRPCRCTVASPATLAAATDKLNVDKLKKHLLFAGQAPPPEPAAAPTLA